MEALEQEIKERKEAALAEIKRRYGTEEDEHGVTLFVSHHLEEIEESYWQDLLGTKKPTPAEVLDALVLDSHWSPVDEGEDDDEDYEDDDDIDENGIKVFDFTLPKDATNYLISVSFDDEGKIEDVSMES